MTTWNFFGLKLKRPTSTGITWSGVFATVLMLSILSVHRALELPTSWQMAVDWWCLSFWAAFNASMGLRVTQSARALLVLVIGYLTIEFVVAVVFSL